MMIAVGRGGILGACDELNICNDIYDTLMSVDRTKRFGFERGGDCERYTICCSDGVGIVASREGGDARLEIVYDGLNDRENAIVVDCLAWLDALDLQSRVVSYLDDRMGAEV